MGAMLAFTIFSIRFILFRKFDAKNVERVFRYLQVFTACYLAFAHGSNDVANAVAPLAPIFGLTSEGYYEIPRELLIFGVGLAGGLASVNLRVVQKIIFS